LSSAADEQQNASDALSGSCWRYGGRRVVYGSDDVILGEVKGDALRNWVTGKVDPADSPKIAHKLVIIIPYRRTFNMRSTTDGYLTQCTNSYRMGTTQATAPFLEPATLTFDFRTQSHTHS